MFAIPWHEHVVVGTTDTPIDALDLGFFEETFYEEDFSPVAAITKAKALPVAGRWK